jgi:hypothetical protein
VRPRAPQSTVRLGVNRDGQVAPGMSVGLESLFDFPVDLIATLVAFQNVSAALRPEAGPATGSVVTDLLSRRLSQVLTAPELAADYSERALLEMRQRLWDSLVRHAAAIERGSGDAARVRLLRKKARDFYRQVAADRTAADAKRIVAWMLGVTNESGVRALLRPDELSARSRFAVEDVEARVLRPPAPAMAGSSPPVSAAPPSNDARVAKGYVRYGLTGTPANMGHLGHAATTPTTSPPPPPPDRRRGKRRPPKR